MVAGGAVAIRPDRYLLWRRLLAGTGNRRANYRKESIVATHSITAVRMEEAPGASHEHIARVKLLGHTQDYARAEIIAAIRRGQIFYTHAVPPARVYVHGCPYCYASDYITTHPDNTPTNNLLRLPRY